MGLSKIGTAIMSSLRKFGKFCARLSGAELVLTASQLPEIRAAARYWREQIERGNRFKTVYDPLAIKLHAYVSKEELDAFEEELAMEFARQKVHCKDAATFTERGLDISLHLTLAASAAGFNDKVDYFGFMTRMRILPDRVDREVGDVFDYRKGQWRNVWSRQEVV